MNVLIVYGGKSCEHDISIITACLAKGYFKGNVYSAYLDKSNCFFLAGNDWTPRDHLNKKFTHSLVFLFGEGAIGIVKGKRIVKRVSIDVVVNCCHGVNGEDGTVAALCQLTGVPLVGSDIVSSALAMDKTLTKKALTALKLPNVKGCEIHKDDDVATQIDGLDFPLIIKPAMLGSSIGVEICHSYEELTSALQRAFRYDSKVLCEEALTDFIELNCAAMRVNGEVQTSVVDCPLTVNDILTFADKYVQNSAFDKPPIQVDADIVLQVSSLTKYIYERLGFGGVIRVDYLLDKRSGKLYVNEINTTPGSLAYGLWEATYSRTQYGEVLVEQAIADYRELQQRVFTFESGVLQGGNGIKKK